MDLFLLKACILEPTRFVAIRKNGPLEIRLPPTP
jgi:hypothetical protein